MARVGVLVGLLLIGGCFPLVEGEKTTALVSNNPFGVEPPPKAPTRATYAPANETVSRRVDKVGRDLLAANKQLGLKPVFATIGVEQPEVFHIDTSWVYVTEGLVKQCKSDPELAAVLSVELGRMVAEREARTSPEVRNPEKLPPIRVPVGNNAQGRETDFTTLAELSRFEKANPRTPPRNLPRPDPMKLARTYLENAGFQAADLDRVDPLLQAAEKNVALERQFKGVQPQSPWQP
jgi:hypothetical protein